MKFKIKNYTCAAILTIVLACAFSTPSFAQCSWCAINYPACTTCVSCVYATYDEYPLTSPTFTPNRTNTAARSELATSGKIYDMQVIVDDASKYLGAVSTTSGWLGAFERTLALPAGSSYDVRLNHDGTEIMVIYLNSAGDLLYQKYDITYSLSINHITFTWVANSGIYGSGTIATHSGSNLISNNNIDIDQNDQFVIEWLYNGNIYAYTGKMPTGGITAPGISANVQITNASPSTTGYQENTHALYPFNTFSDGDVCINTDYANTNTIVSFVFIDNNTYSPAQGVCLYQCYFSDLSSGTAGTGVTNARNAGGSGAPISPVTSTTVKHTRIAAPWGANPPFSKTFLWDYCAVWEYKPSTSYYITTSVEHFQNLTGSAFNVNDITGSHLLISQQNHLPEVAYIGDVIHIIWKYNDATNHINTAGSTNNDIIGYVLNWDGTPGTCNSVLGYDAAIIPCTLGHDYNIGGIATSDLGSGYSSNSHAYYGYYDDALGFRGMYFRNIDQASNKNDPSEYTSATIDNLGIIIYPNPASRFLNIVPTSTGSTSDIIAKIYDITGKLVKEATIKYNNKLVLELDKLDLGVYIINIKQGNKISVQKFAITN